MLSAASVVSYHVQIITLTGKCLVLVRFLLYTSCRFPHFKKNNPKPSDKCQVWEKWQPAPRWNTMPTRLCPWKASESIFILEPLWDGSHSPRCLDRQDVHLHSTPDKHQFWGCDVTNFRSHVLKTPPWNDSDRSKGLKCRDAAAAAQSFLWVNNRLPSLLAAATKPAQI